MANNKFYKGIKTVFGGIVTLVMRIHCHGNENEIAEGGAIIAANHISMADPVALVVAFKRQLRILGKKEVFKVPVLSWFARSMGAYSVDRGKGDVAAMKKTLSLLHDGEAVCMFPQGKRYPGVELDDSQLKNGIGMMVVRSGVPVQPVYIKTKNNKFRLFRRVDIYIGEKMVFDIPENIENKPELYADISKQIFDRICELKEQNK